jgi:phosphoglycolate phosphatase-like HAD superfamily hydrolase
MLLKHLEYFNCLPAHALMIGDAPADSEASRAAEIPFAAALWSDLHEKALLETHPDFVLRQPMELFQIISSNH